MEIDKKIDKLISAFESLEFSLIGTNKPYVQKTKENQKTIDDAFLFEVPQKYRLHFENFSKLNDTDKQTLYKNIAYYNCCKTNLQIDANFYAQMNKKIVEYSKNSLGAGISKNVFNVKHK
jgi:hypothetical protein